MSRKANDTAPACPMSPEERLALHDMMAAVRATSEANAIRAALWRFSEHLGMNLPLRVFRLRGIAKPRAPRNKKKLNTNLTVPRVRKPESRPQPASHPWRRTTHPEHPSQQK